MSKKLAIIAFTVFIIALIGALVTLGVTGFASNKMDINSEKTESIEGVTTLKIQTNSAKLKLTLVDGNEIKAKYYGSMYCLVCSNTNLEINKSGNNMVVTTGSGWFQIGFYSDLTLEVFLPKDYHENLRIDSVSSDLTFSDKSFKQLTLNTVSGSINLNNVSFTKGNFSTVSGNITGSNLSGSVKAETVSGNINIATDNGSFDGNSVSGNVYFTTTDSNVFINIETVSGKIVIDINNDIRFSLDKDTVSGNLENQLNVNLDGSSTNRIKVETVSGDITIK